ncbi:hypothetical protein GOP47_0030118 [Adiantum capillus-veneris]|nr:hypothetical protein GOP47_0030118 [Adiantum capillus-veneris]
MVSIKLRLKQIKARAQIVKRHETLHDLLRTKVFCKLLNESSSSHSWETGRLATGTVFKVKRGMLLLLY